MSPIDQLPEDPKALKQVIADLYGRLQKQDAENEQLRHQLQQLLRARYGRKSELFDPSQLTIFASSPAPAATVATVEPVTKPTTPSNKKHGRRMPSRELPRKQVTYELAEDELPCPDCGDSRKRIGEETSEQYDYIPSSITVIEHVRCKYACPKCQGHVVVADGALKPIDRGLATAGMLAHIAVSKFADHLPLHRLEGIFKREGAIIARSTMCDWLAGSAKVLEPLYERMKERVMASRIVWTDDTPIDLQDRQHEKNMREARIWVYIGDKDNKYTIYDFTDSRKRDGPKKFLHGFKGYLQADAFAGYDCLYVEGDVLEVACMAHARRKFFECLDSNKTAASEALTMIGELYRIEKESAGLGAVERRKVRIQQSAPLLAAFKRWLNQQRLLSLPKSPLGKAITYALNNWSALCRYLCDGELTIDNNCSERAMRGVAVGRKNWLFAGSKEGGKTAAILSSFIATCKHYNVNPRHYLLDVLTRLTQGEADLDALLPGTWAQAALTSGSL